MTQYFLPKHVYFCHHGDTVVFLDLKNDEYTMIDGDQASFFCSIFSDARDLPSQGKGSLRDLVPEHTDTSGLLSDLVNDGLLTNAASRQSKPVLPTVTSPPMEHLVGEETIAMSIHMGHVWSFLASCVVASMRLRLCHIETTVNAVSRRKALRSDGKPFDFDRARELVAVFNKLRCWFPADYLCLFDSLALVEFLSRYDVFPHWIFGVRPSLWAAHCWIQEGTVAFNEGTEAAESYIPIMVV